MARRGDISAVLSPDLLKHYPRHTAAQRAITEVPLAKRNETIQAVLRRLRQDGASFKSMDYVYVVGKNNTLHGVVSLKSLLSAPYGRTLGSLMKTPVVFVSPETHQEKAADLAVKHNIKAIPVVKRGRLLGVVPMRQILLILNRALREDVLYLAGIHKAHLNYENTLAVPLFLSLVHRLPWLLVGLIGISMAAAFIGVFEAVLQQYLLLAFFIPAILYMAAALSVQHQTLFVRDLAILGKELRLKAYFLKQMLIGSLLAVLVGVVMFSIITLFWKETFLASVIALAMFFTLLASSFTSLAVTFIINKLHLDPALGSGPLATIISDVTSIVIYFTVAFALLGGL